MLPVVCHANIARLLYRAAVFSPPPSDVCFRAEAVWGDASLNAPLFLSSISSGNFSLSPSLPVHISRDFFVDFSAALLESFIGGRRKKTLVCGVCKFYISPSVHKEKPFAYVFAMFILLRGILVARGKFTSPCQCGAPLLLRLFRVISCAIVQLNQLRESHWIWLIEL